MTTFKICQVLLLPTNEKTDLYIPFPLDKLYQSISKIDRASSYTDVSYQNLCFLSDDKTELDNWCYGMDGIFQYKGNVNIPDVELPKKIIAITNKLILKISKSINKEQFPDILVPQPSQSFIEYYISEYNKGNVITEVMVEYEQKQHFEADKCKRKNSLNGVWYENKLKINPDNTITIKPIKYSWNKEELKSISYRFRNHCIKYNFNTKEEIYLAFDEWIDGNI